MKQPLIAADRDSRAPTAGEAAAGPGRGCGGGARPAPRRGSRARRVRRAAAGGGSSCRSVLPGGGGFEGGSCKSCLGRRREGGEKRRFRAVVARQRESRVLIKLVFAGGGTQLACG